MAGISKEDLRHREEVATKLASLGGKLDTKFAILDGKLDNLHTKVDSISKLAETVHLHDRQLHIWQGIGKATVTVLGLIVTGLFAVLGKFKRWF